MRTVLLAVLMLVLAAPLARAEEPPPIKKDCKTCHVSHYMESGELLRAPLSALCIECHPERARAEHVVDVVPTMKVIGLPLDAEGRMTCVTCHDPHGSTGIVKMLREWPSKICGKCHRK